MSGLTKILTGAAGLAAVVGFASPAAAQYYPGYGGQGGIIGTIINGVIGGGQLGYGNQYGRGQNHQLAVSQCSRAVESQLGGGYNNGYGGYNNGYGGYNSGYGNYGYNQNQSRGRVVGITSVEQRSSGVRVRGVAASNSGYGGGYSGGYGGYGNAYGAQADLSFSCKVDFRGQVVDLDLDRRNVGYNNGYRGY